jgi:hypothetical protein
MGRKKGRGVNTEREGLGPVAFLGSEGRRGRGHGS